MVAVAAALEGSSGKAICRPLAGVWPREVVVEPSSECTEAEKKQGVEAVASSLCLARADARRSGQRDG